MRTSIVVLGVIASLALTVGCGVASAKPEVGAPRQIIAVPGEQKGIRLLTNDRLNWHWLWIKRPSAEIVLAHPPERLPENDEALNGVAGRTGVFVTGRAPGNTTAVLGYYSADESRLLKTVVLHITVHLRSR